MKDLFDQVITQFKTKSQYDRFIKKCDKDFDIKVYRMPTYSLEYASNIYREMQQK